MYYGKMKMETLLQVFISYRPLTPIRRSVLQHSRWSVSQTVYVQVINKKLLLTLLIPRFFFRQILYSLS